MGIGMGYLVHIEIFRSAQSKAFSVLPLLLPTRCDRLFLCDNKCMRMEAFNQSEAYQLMRTRCVVGTVPR